MRSRIQSERGFFGSAPKGAFVFSVLAIACLLSACSEKEWGPDVEFSGHLTTLVDVFPPRQLYVSFYYEPPPDPAEVETLVISSGSTILSSSPSGRYLIETPLGKSLDEVAYELEVDLLAPNCMPNLYGFLDSYGSFILHFSDGSGRRCWLTGATVDIPRDFVRQYIVKVHGFFLGEDGWDGTPIVEPVWVDVLGERIVSKSGALLLFDRGTEGIVVILLESSGDAWELLGPLAQEIGEQPGADGAPIIVRGCELVVSTTSRAGGYVLVVKSYSFE